MPATTDVATAARHAEAARLRDLGLTYGQIGAVLYGGVDAAGAARNAVLQHRARTNSSAPALRKFGVEIEVGGLSTDAAAAAITAAGVTCYAEGYNHVTRAHWKAVPDSTVRGCEVVSPPLDGADSFDQIRKVMAALRAAGGRVTVSAGLHVHFDTSDLTPAMIAAFTVLYGRNEGLLDGLVARSRRGNGNRWCRTVNLGQSVADVEGVLSRGAADRYRKVNLAALRAHGTVEIRHHGCTLNAKKVTAWVSLLAAMIDYSKTVAEPETFATIGDLFDALLTHGLDGDSRSTLMARWIANNPPAARAAAIVAEAA